MARSIAQQIGCSIPIELAVFYNRAEDATLLAEGATLGPNPPKLTLVHVRDQDILRRALLFSEAHRIHTHSHTVFADADLWFPPTFWATFAQALAVEKPGYWSCRVLNIALEKMEKHLEQWQNISEDRLNADVEGTRYDAYAGQVGHFQCVPRDLLEYPATKMIGVEQVDLSFAKLAVSRSQDTRSERRIGTVPAYHLDHPPSWKGTGGVQL